MCMKFNFISICTYLCGVCPMYCSCSNYFGPNEFGYHFVLEFVLGTLEMHWKLVSYTRKVVSPCAYWSQAWMIVNSYLLHHQCYLGNKYLSHAYFYLSTLCRLYLGTNFLCANTWYLSRSIPFITLSLLDTFDAMMSVCWEFIYTPLRLH